MDLFGVGSITQAMVSAINNTVNAAQQEKWNKIQQENWENQFAYTKWLNDTMMKREDTAVQRSVADHEAAGFNKLLAIGQPSQAGTLTSFTGNAGGSAPQIDIKNPIEAYLEAKQINAQTQLTEAQAKLVNEQATTETSKRNLYESQKTLNEAMKAKTQEDKKLVTEKIKTEIANQMQEQWDLYLSVVSGSKSFEQLAAQSPWAMGWKLALKAMFGQNFDADGWIKNIIEENKEVEEKRNKNASETIINSQNSEYGSGRGHIYGY